MKKKLIVWIVVAAVLFGAFAWVKNVYNQMSRFNAGLIPISDVLMNQTNLFEATENLIDKQIEYSKALTAYNGRKSE